MKKLCLGALAAILTFGVTGCSNNSGETKSSDSGDVVELKYWYAWTDKIAENNKEKVEDFNNTIGKEKGIHITAEYQGTYDDLHAKLQSAFVANEQPAVSVMEMRAFKPSQKAA